MAKKSKIDAFSDEFAVKLLDSIEEDVLRDVFQLVETLINDEMIFYRVVPSGVELSMNTDFEKDLDLKIPRIANFTSRDTIIALMRVIISFIEEKGEKHIKSILDITEDQSSEILLNNISLLESLIIKSESLLSHVIYASFNKSMKFENFDYHINLDSLIINEKDKFHLIQTPVGYLSLKYYDPLKGKSNFVNLSLTKANLEEFKKDVNKFYDEFEVYEKFVKQKKKQRNQR